MRETAAYKCRIFALFLIVAALLHETHLGLSEISNIGRCYRQVHQCISDDFSSSEVLDQSTADTIECVENAIVLDACTRELLDSSQNRVLNGIYRSIAGRKKEAGTAFRHFPLAALFFGPAAAVGLRLFSRFFFPCPARELLLILDYIHKMDGKK